MFENYVINAQLIDYQGQFFGKNCTMEVHIGQVIKKVMQEKGVKPGWLAQKINTSVRNMINILSRYGTMILLILMTSSVGII